MKPVQSTMYEAIDGQRFDTEDACLKHEVALLDQLIGSLKFDDVRDALKRHGILVRAAPVPKAGRRPMKDAAE